MEKIIQNIEASEKVNTTKGSRNYKLEVKYVENEKSKSRYIVLENYIDGKKRGRFILPIGLRQKAIEILKDITKADGKVKHFKNSEAFQVYLTKLNSKQKKEAFKKLEKGEIVIG